MDSLQRLLGLREVVRWSVLAKTMSIPSMPLPGRPGQDLWSIVSRRFSGLPGDAVSYRIFLPSRFIEHNMILNTVS